MGLPTRAQTCAPVWTSAPPKSKRPHVPRFHVFSGPQHQFALLNAAVCGVLVHYDKDEQRTNPCGGADCWADHNRVPTRWQGWVSAMSLTSKAVGLLHLTPGLVADVPRLVDTAATLRGLILTVWRGGKTDRTTLHGKLSAELYKHKLPGALDVQGHLLRIWTGSFPEEVCDA